MIDNIFTGAIAVFVFMVIMYIIAQIKSDNSIIDIGWGIGFIIVVLSQLWITLTIDSLDILISLIIFLWGIRLAMHIFLRNKGKAEDFRYAEWRKDWGKSAAIQAFFKVFMLQGIVLLIVANPIILIFSISDNSISLFAILGSIVFLFGFFFEVVGDIQLNIFKTDPGNKGKIITTGLWRVTRHPNYFGESVIWWGIFIITIGTDFWYTAIISPVLINFLLLKISGVPMLEKKYEGKPDWEEYKRKTPAFVPWIGMKG